MSAPHKFLPRNETVQAATARVTRRIRDIRRAQKITQKQMAEALGITERSYSDKENPAKPSEFKLSEILAISKKTEMMAGLLVADHWNPEQIGAVMKIVSTLTELQPAIEFCQAAWDKAVRNKDDVKARQTAETVAKKHIWFTPSD